MDPEMRELISRIDARLGSLSSQVEEMRASVRQVVAVAEADPEMALTKARKVLESVLRRVWEHFIPGEPVGTRPLEEIIQRLQKNGYLPRKQAAYAISVKELGNVGTHVHDETVDKADVVHVLSPLIAVLEWYFEQEWANPGDPAKEADRPPPSPAAGRNREDSAPAPVPAQRGARLSPLALATAVALTVILVAGLYFILQGRSAPRNEVVSPQNDQDRIQERWEAVEAYTPKSKDSNLAKGGPKIVWTFRGRELTITEIDDGREDVKQRGAFSLSSGGERKFLDYSTTGPDGQPVEFNGIYEFVGAELKICYGIRLDPKSDTPVRRPESFAAGSDGFRRAYFRFKRPAG
jgi:uncharacterized protein (TIGR03067 family)